MRRFLIILIVSGIYANQQCENLVVQVTDLQNRYDNIMHILEGRLITNGNNNLSNSPETLEERVSYLEQTMPKMLEIKMGWPGIMGARGENCNCTTNNTPNSGIDFETRLRNVERDLRIFIKDFLKRKRNK